MNFKNISKNKHDDHYTPENAVFALLDHIKFDGNIWECAAGKGHITKVLNKFYSVYSSDIKGEYNNIDFLSYDGIKYDNIVTNPPYSLAENFIRKAVQFSNKKVAMLLRLSFMESIKRYKLFTDLKPSKIIVISKRLKFNRDDEKWHNSAQFAHAWYVWDHNNSNSYCELLWSDR